MVKIVHDELTALMGGEAQGVNLNGNPAVILMSGLQGSGKTTLLNILSNFINPNERIITIEDAVELKLRQSHVISLETRISNYDSKSEITIRDLVRNSLRMRPDRIIVGEVRGKEAFDMLQAMNTGHDGSLSTGHANSSKDMLSRLETMVLMGMDIPVAAIEKQIASAIDIIIGCSVSCQHSFGHCIFKLRIL